MTAIDGSKIPLPNRKELLDRYGSMGRGAGSSSAIASVAFDVLNDRVPGAQLEPVSVDERKLAARHMENIKSRARTDLLYTIFVFDRGYASKEMISYIEDTIHVGYLFRLRPRFNNAIDGLPAPESQDGITDNIPDFHGRKARVIKFYLPSGTLETLVTNDFGLGKDMFRRLYFLRWPAEENYKLVKEKTDLTNYRGCSENSVLQEFWIYMLPASLSHAIKKETDGIIDSTISQEGQQKQVHDKHE